MVDDRDVQAIMTSLFDANESSTKYSDTSGKTMKRKQAPTPPQA